MIGTRRARTLSLRLNAVLSGWFGTSATRSGVAASVVFRTATEPDELYQAVRNHFPAAPQAGRAHAYIARMRPGYIAFSIGNEMVPQLLAAEMYFKADGRATRGTFRFVEWPAGYLDIFQDDIDGLRESVLRLLYESDARTAFFLQSSV
ncbi:hypothetical protein [Nocardia sp. NPDC057030]|uniref:hypothetical protein n=1 Tax=unclassified Nocardia TaxID=2637762 RepID=UPI003634838A